MLLDACVLIDVTRGRDDAVAFLESLERAPAISSLTVTELLFGARSSSESARLEALFESMDVLSVDREVARLGATFLGRYKASHGADIVDALIAATAKLHELPLATLNLKHFPMFEGLARPY